MRWRLPEFGLGWKVAVGTGAAALGMLLWQHLRVADLKAAVAKAEAEKASLVAQVATEQAQRASLVLTYQAQLAAADRNFTTTQLEKEHAFQQQIAKLDDRRRADSVQLARLRDTISIYATAAGSPAPYSSAPASSVSGLDRPATLGSLLYEGAELAVESRALLERREAELNRVLDELYATRARCDAGVTDSKPLIQ